MSKSKQIYQENVVTESVFINFKNTGAIPFLSNE
jgi:hypothetical protein